MNKYVVVVLLLVVSVLPGLSWASVTNGDFSNGLDEWTHNDYVSNGGGYAFFTENYGGDKMSTLSQGIDIAVGDQLSFDYKLISRFVMGGPAGSDTFYVSLGETEIFSIDNHGLASEGGEIPPDPLSMAPFSMDVSSFAGSNVELKFVLFSDDALDAVYDTTVKLYNVDISSSAVIVPVPSAMLLVGLGAASVTWLRRRRVL